MDEKRPGAEWLEGMRKAAKEGWNPYGFTKEDREQYEEMKKDLQLAEILKNLREMKEEINKLNSLASHLLDASKEQKRAIQDVENSQYKGFNF